MASTRLQIRGRRVVLGGDEHVGWLPDGAASPQPTASSKVLVDFVIEGDDHGAMLYWHGHDGSHWDVWRESVAGAVEEAESSWGIKPHEWEEAR
jgi:hypothetical protein